MADERVYKVKPSREFHTGKNSKTQFGVFEATNWICFATTHTTAKELMPKGISPEAAEDIIRQINALKEKNI